MRSHRAHGHAMLIPALAGLFAPFAVLLPAQAQGIGPYGATTV